MTSISVLYSIAENYNLSDRERDALQSLHDGLLTLEDAAEKIGMPLRGAAFNFLAGNGDNAIRAFWSYIQGTVIAPSAIRAWNWMLDPTARLAPSDKGAPCRCQRQAGSRDAIRVAKDGTLEINIPDFSDGQRKGRIALVKSVRFSQILLASHSRYRDDSPEAAEARSKDLEAHIEDMAETYLAGMPEDEWEGMLAETADPTAEMLRYASILALKVALSDNQMKAIQSLFKAFKTAE